MRVDVSAAPDVCVGDTAVIVGRQGSEEIGLSEVARHQGVRPLEITAQFPAGIPRTYLDATQR
jgi:alanine racemase